MKAHLQFEIFSMAKKIKNDPEFRSFYDAITDANKNELSNKLSNEDISALSYATGMSTAAELIATNDKLRQATKSYYEHQHTHKEELQ